ncbi:GILT-like protein 1 isoform X2 [Hyposmocoma kahamanoa]|uniref:GILT-like protein 1 isoform X2 n=1 Tax=Hyposmocoma kahamanoa TaxID=1477025 RepID=UPI000E6D8D2E|nr:GILT-like protein 1 isoform X2 [Hyposmocoma kahamanoa]
MLHLISWMLFSTTMGWEKVRIDEYYESRCKDCKKFYTRQLANVVKQLNDYIELRTYPYGNTKMTQNDENVTFQCEHGRAECYGNGLHACAIYYLPDKSFYVPYNSCLMAWDSTDQAADQCSNNEVISSVIKTCAKGYHAVELLKYYAKETAKLTDKKLMPYTIVNGKVLQPQDRLMDKVCAAFKNPPQACIRTKIDI